MTITKKAIRIFKTDLVQVSSWSAVATAVKMATSLVLSKLLAVFVGPAGVALIGQLMNGVAIFLNLSNGAIHVGITKYTAEYEAEPEKRQQLFNSALVITIICSLAIGVLLILFNRPLSSYLLKTQDYGYVIIILGATLWLYALNINLLAITNGLKQYKVYIIANITSSLFGLALTFILVKFWGINGALVAAATFQSLVVFITASLIYLKQKHLYFTAFRLSKRDARLLLGFSVMSLISAIVVPWAQIDIRNYITRTISLDKAGLWESMNRISFAYLSVFTLGLQTYFLPKLSSTNDKKILRHEIKKAYKFMLPILVVSAAAVFFSRDIIIRILFTSEFLNMRDLFIWQLAGDVIKLCGWLLAILFLAKKMVKWFIITEVYFSLQYVFLAHIFVNAFGLQGACMAYVLNYFIYFSIVCLIIRKEQIL